MSLAHERAVRALDQLSRTYAAKMRGPMTAEERERLAAAYERERAEIEATVVAPQPFRAVVRDSYGAPSIVNVEAPDVVEAAHRAAEFGTVTAVWVTR